MVLPPTVLNLPTCIWKPEGKNVVTAMVLPPTIKVLNLPTVYAMYMEAGGKNVVTAMVLLPTIKVLNLPRFMPCIWKPEEKM